MSALIQRPAPSFTATAVIEGQSLCPITKDNGTRLELLVWILVTYGSDFTFVCPTEILAFNDNLAKFKELNTVVLGASTDSEYSHFAWANQPRKEGGIGPNLYCFL
ncbi:peroxiredoxin TSA1 [Amanita muscaria]